MRNSQTILLAEDNPDDVLLAQIAFERAGLTPRLVVVSNGEEAIRYLKGEDPYADRSRFPFPNLSVRARYGETAAVCGCRIFKS